MRGYCAACEHSCRPVGSRWACAAGSGSAKRVCGKKEARRPVDPSVDQSGAVYEGYDKERLNRDFLAFAQGWPARGQRWKGEPMGSQGDAPGDLPMLLFQDHEAWAAWLDENHDTSPGVWLCLAK